MDKNFVTMWQTASFDVNIDAPIRAIWTEIAGTIVLMDHTGSSKSFTVEASRLYPFSPKQIVSSGTTLTEAQIHVCG